MDEDDINVHESPSRPKWSEKTLQVAGDLAANPLDPRKTRSQFHNASYASEISLAEHYYMMMEYDTHSYQEYFHDPMWKSSIQDEFNSL